MHKVVLSMVVERPSSREQILETFELRVRPIRPRLDVGDALDRLEGHGDIVRVQSGSGEHYQITERGRQALEDWYRLPVELREPERGISILLKVMAAYYTPGWSFRDVCTMERGELNHRLESFIGWRRSERWNRDAESRQRMERWIANTRARIRWLDECEARLISGDAHAEDWSSYGFVGDPFPGDPGLG